MRTFRQKFIPAFLSLAYLAIFSAGRPVFAEATETKNAEAHHAHGHIDWPGIYNGFTPCADCIGIKTTLALNANDSYVLLTKFTGKSEREFVEKGKFTWNDASNIITLTPRNSTTSQQYLVAENMLIQLDNNGNRFTGKLADRYILRRNDITQTAPSHSH
ncbi:copper resistance protein NlpE N-terminal domain-containing protein [Methylomonas paludis]|uniref:Copper resistance protein NlpE N-terminal domain-containing protein n=1 Tax=Methylomonas paludis TaxID=1173101 RepID=A0A975MQH1_9GAMM|nr:copper resistance protein NlpE [Methylomonas paludis]QWF71651.1 copper resistance protein NlpE N-terminal domain-containing protein [Methylomonas paludis]